MHLEAPTELSGSTALLDLTWSTNSELRLTGGASVSVVRAQVEGLLRVGPSATFSAHSAAFTSGGLTLENRGRVILRRARIQGAEGIEHREGTAVLRDLWIESSGAADAPRDGLRQLGGTLDLRRAQIFGASRVGLLIDGQEARAHVEDSAVVGTTSFADQVPQWGGNGVRLAHQARAQLRRVVADESAEVGIGVEGGAVLDGRDLLILGTRSNHARGLVGALLVWSATHSLDRVEIVESTIYGAHFSRSAGQIRDLRVEDNRLNAARNGGEAVLLSEAQASLQRAEIVGGTRFGVTVGQLSGELLPSQVLLEDLEIRGTRAAEDEAASALWIRDAAEVTVRRIRVRETEAAGIRCGASSPTHIEDLDFGILDPSRQAARALGLELVSFRGSYPEVHLHRAQLIGASRAGIEVEVGHLQAEDLRIAQVAQFAGSAACRMDAKADALPGQLHLRRFVFSEATAGVILEGGLLDLDQGALSDLSLGIQLINTPDATNGLNVRLGPAVTFRRVIEHLDPKLQR